MVRISDMRTAEQVHQHDLHSDLEYRRAYERNRLAGDVAVKVVKYRTDHGLTQAALARKLGMRQPHIARLEAGDHEPTLSTLYRLAHVLGLDFSVDVKPGRMQLRYAVRDSDRKRA